MQYGYNAKSVSGELRTGVLTARSVDQVKLELRAQQLFPIDVWENSTSGWWASVLRHRDRSGLNKRDLLSITTQLAVMTRSGIDLVSALQSLSAQCRNVVLRRVLTKVHKDVTGGKAVSDAIREQAHIFGDTYVASVAAGEAAGRLPDVFQRLAQLLRAELRNRNRVRSLIAYPILLASVSMLVVLGCVGFVLPQFASIFEQFEVPLPVLTQILLAVANTARNHILIWAPVGVILAVAGIVMLNTVTGRRYWDTAVLNIVLLRDISRSFNVGRTFRLLGLMIESGVPLLEGLRLTRKSVRNVLFRGLFDDLEEAILNGRTLATALTEADFLPGAAREMMMTAERTGTLGPVTQMIGEHYEEEGEAKLQELASVLEPMIIIVMGGIVATVVLAVMLPMFDIATLTRH